MTALSAQSKYILNRYFGAAARKVGLGDLLEDALVTAISDLESEDANGTIVSRRVRAEFDYSDQPLTGAATLLASALIPDNAIITNAFIDVTETFTSDDTTPDDTSIGIGVETVGAGSEDLINAAKILTATDWDVGLKQCIPDKATVGDYVKTTAAKNITVNVVNGAGVTSGLTAGHMVVFIDYVVSE